MSLLVDTDICSAHLKNRGSMAHRFIQHGGRIHVSTITAMELYTWAFRHRHLPARVDLVDELLSVIEVIPVDQVISRRAGAVRGLILEVGRDIAPTDLIIAATALVHDLTLVTHNTRDFQAVPGCDSMIGSLHSDRYPRASSINVRTY
jgi:tRNA(fMet)-specific endonuclease VapC